MKAKEILRAAVLLLAAAAMLLLFGCGEKEPVTAPENELQDVPDIFIDDGAGLGNQDTPPALVLETVSGETASALNATLGGYVWRWIDEDGREKLSEEEAPSAAEMKDIAVIKRSQTEGSVRLQINGGTLLRVRMWQDGAPMEESEKIITENNTIVLPQSGACRYEVVVDYEGGRVYYAFMVTD